MQCIRLRALNLAQSSVQQVSILGGQADLVYNPPTSHLLLHLHLPSSHPSLTSSTRSSTLFEVNTIVPIHLS